jgi:hypothetical protein
MLSMLSRYATPSSSAVDLWKKLARKAELEWTLEVDIHRKDNTKNNATIQRLSRRYRLLSFTFTSTPGSSPFSLFKDKFTHALLPRFI